MKTLPAGFNNKFATAGHRALGKNHRGCLWFVLNVWMEWQVALSRKNHPKFPGCIVGKKDARVWALAFPDDSSV